MRVFKLFLSFAILVPSMIWAAVGKLTVVKGEVAILRGGKTTPAQSGSTVEEKDAIVSQAGGAAQLVLNDGTAVSVGSKTTFKIHEYLFEEGNPSKANAKFGAIQGAFKAVTGKIGKVAPNNFKLETKTATIGIRGTRFLGVIPEKGPETIACTKGEITVTPLPAPTITAPVAASSQGQGGSGSSGGGKTGGAPASSSGGSSGSSGGASGGSAPSPAAAAPAPAPAPEPVVVKAGEMTTVSVGAVEPPKPFTQAELKKLESAASTPAKEEKQEAKTEAKAEKSAEKQEAKKEETKTEEKKESKQEPAAQKTETKAEVKTEKVETKEAAPAPAPAPKVEAATPAAPPPPPTIATVTVPSSVTDSANAANLAAQQEANDKLAIEKAIDGKDFTVLIKYLSGSYSSQVKTGITLIINNAAIQNDLTVLMNALSTADTFIVSLAQSKVTDLIVGSKNYAALSNALNSNNLYLQNLVKDQIAAWEAAGDQNALSGAVAYGGALGTYAQSALDSLISGTQVAIQISPSTRLTFYSVANQTSITFPTFEAVGLKPIATTFPSAGSVYRYFTIDGDTNNYNPYELSAQAFLNTTNKTIMHTGLNVGTTGSYYLESELEIGKLSSSGFTISGYQLSNQTNYNGTSNVQEAPISGMGIVHNSGSSNSDYAYLRISLGVADNTTKSIVGLRDKEYTIVNESPSITNGTLATNSYTSSTYKSNGTWSGFVVPTSQLGSLSSVSGWNIMLPSTPTSNDFSVLMNKMTGDAVLSFGTVNSGWEINFAGSLQGGVEAAYISEDMWGLKNFKMTGLSTSNAYIYTLPDKINQTTGSLEYSNDYSSWGVGTTKVLQESGNATWIGNFVAGAITPTSTLDALEGSKKVYTYFGHALGNVMYGNSFEPILLDLMNKTNLKIAFGGASPVTGSVEFQTSNNKVWSMGLSSSSYSNSNFTANLEGTANGASVTGSLTGFYFGPHVESVGGSFVASGNTIVANGVVKASKVSEGTYGSATIAITSIAGDNTLDATEASTINTITGTVGASAKEGDTVTLYVNNSSYTGTVQANKTFIVSNVAGSDLAASNGTIRASVLATDVDNNKVLGSCTTTFTIDTAIPQKPVLGLLTPSVAQNSMPTIKGKTDPFKIVEIYSNGTWLTTLSSDSAGNFTYTSPSLANGSYAFTAVVTGTNSVTSDTLNVGVLAATSYLPVSSPYATNDPSLNNNALKVVYAGTTQYFKYASNPHTYGAGDISFSNLSDLALKLQSFLGSNVEVSFNTTTFDISIASLASANSLVIGSSDGQPFLGSTIAYNNNYTTTSGTNEILLKAAGVGSIYHNTLLMGDGNILIVGDGYSGGQQYGIKLYNPSTQALTTIDNTTSIMNYAFPDAQMMADGRVLIFGGSSYWGCSGCTAPNYYYNYQTNSFSPAPNLNVGRELFSSAVIHSGGAYSGSFGGSIIAFGGYSTAPWGTILNSTEMFHNEQWSLRANMPTARWLSAAAGLLDGSVMVMGGSTNYGSTNIVEKYLPSTDQWVSAPSMSLSREQFSAVALPNGHILVFGGFNTSYEEFDGTGWTLKVGLPSNMYGQRFAVVGADGKVLLVNNSGIYSYDVSASSVTTAPTTLINTSTTYQVTPNDYNSGDNDGYFIGMNSTLNSKVFGKINAMLFNQNLSTVSATTGQLSGTLGSLDGYNTTTSQFDFSNFSSVPTEFGSSTVLYNREDDKIIWGTASINNKSAIIGFAALPDKVNANNSLSHVDDYSSWGYWEAVTNDSTLATQNYYSGYWVSGQPTPASYVQQMINQNTVATYSGHIMGNTLNGNVKDSIVLNNNNQLNMTVNFGAANPVNVTALKFETSQGWSYNNTGGFSGTSVVTVDSINNTQKYISNVTNGVDSLSLQGKFYGPTANSTGGIVSGILTGTDNVQRSLQGVYKARQ